MGGKKIHFHNDAIGKEAQLGAEAAQKLFGKLDQGSLKFFKFELTKVTNENSAGKYIIELTKYKGLHWNDVKKLIHLGTKNSADIAAYAKEGGDYSTKATKEFSGFMLCLKSDDIKFADKKDIQEYFDTGLRDNMAKFGLQMKIGRTESYKEMKDYISYIRSAGFEVNFPKGDPAHPKMDGAAVKGGKLYQKMELEEIEKFLKGPLSTPQAIVPSSGQYAGLDGSGKIQVSSPPTFHEHMEANPAGLVGKRYI